MIKGNGVSSIFREKTNPSGGQIKHMTQKKSKVAAQPQSQPPSQPTSQQQIPQKKKHGCCFWFIVVGAIMIVLIVIIFSVSFEKAKNKAKEEQETEEQKTEEDKHTEETELVTKTPEQTIEEVVKNVKAMQGHQNIDENKPKLREVKIVASIEEGKGYKVTIDFNANENFTTNMTKGGIQMDMTDVYKVLFTNQNFNVSEVTINAWFATIDKYGQEGEDIVYKTKLAKEEADKVNWGTDESTLQLEIMPNVWETVHLHSDYQG